LRINSIANPQVLHAWSNKVINIHAARADWRVEEQGIQKEKEFAITPNNSKISYTYKMSNVSLLSAL
jgi:hypothetical protein